MTIGRAYFPDGSQTRSLDGGLEFWKGFFAYAAYLKPDVTIWHISSSVRPTIGRILVNIDIANAAMVERGSLLNVAMKFFETRDLSACNLSGNDPRLVQLKYFLKNIVVCSYAVFKSYESPNLHTQVKVQPDGRKKVIRNLIANAASQTFTNNEGRVVTVEVRYCFVCHHSINVFCNSNITMRFTISASDNLARLAWCSLVTNQTLSS